MKDRAGNPTASASAFTLTGAMPRTSLAKRIPGLVLHQVGLEDFEAYHHMSDWGMDILKVGSALGIGTVAWWDGPAPTVSPSSDSIHCRVAGAGPLLGRIRTDYSAGKPGNTTVNLHSDLSITAGSRMTRHLLSLEGALDNLCTGPGQTARYRA